MPFGSSKAAILGAAGAGGFDMEGGSRTTAGGFNFQTYTSSGTVTVIGEGTVDLILVGAGGGAYGTNGYTGGGGGGGVVHATGVPLVAGEYTLTIGGGGGTQQDGGYTLLADLSLDGNNFNIIAGGGGQGGRGDWGVCWNGSAGSGSMPSDGTYYYRSGGGGGGGGEWNGYCGGSGGSGGASASNTTGSVGTWTVYSGGSGGTDSGVWGSGAGGGSGSGNGGGGSGSSQEGGAGYQWLDSLYYGRGGNGMGDSDTPPALGTKGSGGGGQDPTVASLPGQDGVFIVRWPQ